MVHNRNRRVSDAQLREAGRRNGMRKLVLLFVASTLVVAVGCAQRADVTAETTAVKGVLEKYIASVEKEDMELYAAVMAHDAAMVNFGSGGPPIVGWEALRKVIEDQNAALSETKIGARDVSVKISPTGDWAWATSLWDFKAMAGGKPLALPVRCSWILEKQDGRWVIVHFHKSVAAG
jgi:uncharacterized protein (TIGR02246 family)